MTTQSVQTGTRLTEQEHEDTEKEIVLASAPSLNIEVTQEVIDCAIEKHSGHCVIADAIRKNLPNVKRVEVDIQTIRFTDEEKGFRYIYLTPRTCQQIIVNFDQGTRPKPFTFRLNGKGAQTRLAHNSSEQSRKTKREWNEKQRELRLTQKKIGNGQDSPDIVGGKAPPRIPGGSRRTFGVRGLVV